MARLSALAIALLVAAAVAVGLSACGSSAKLLPGNTASAIRSNLDDVRQLVEEGECPGAADAAAAVGLQVEELTDVDGKLKAALSEGASRLNEVVDACEEADEESTEADEGEEEAPEVEEHEKPAKPKKAKPEKEASPPEETEPPAQEEEKGKKEEGTQEESGGGTPSGGVGTGTAVEGE